MDRGGKAAYPKVAGGEEKSQTALSRLRQAALFKVYTYAEYRRIGPSTSLHVCGFGDPDCDFRLARHRPDTRRYFSEHRHPGHQRDLELHGLPPDDMSGRIVYFSERTLTRTVNDIEHIESQSVTGYGIVKIFFQPTVDINGAQAQVTSISQTVLKLLPPGITPPLVLSYNASSVPIIQVALSSDKLPQAKLNDLGLNFIRPQLATVAGAALPSPYGGVVRQAQVDLDQRALHSSTGFRRETSAMHWPRKIRSRPSAPRKSASSNIRSISTILRSGSKNLTICRSRSSMAPWSICATWPMSTIALRRKPTWFSSKARRACS
jgi:hypothetical protein